MATTLEERLGVRHIPDGGGSPGPGWRGHWRMATEIGRDRHDGSVFASGNGVSHGDCLKGLRAKYGNRRVTLWGVTKAYFTVSSESHEDKTIVRCAVFQRAASC